MLLNYLFTKIFIRVEISNNRVGPYQLKTVRCVFTFAGIKRIRKVKEAVGFCKNIYISISYLSIS